MHGIEEKHADDFDVLTINASWGNAQELRRRYRVTTFPHFAFIRPDGSIVHTWYGPIYNSLVEEVFIQYQAEIDT